MSFDASILPPAPQPPAGGTGSAAGTQPAAFELDGATPCVDRDQAFQATLNRACERKPCTPVRSPKSEPQSAGSTETNPAAMHPQDNRWGTRQQSLADHPVNTEACASAPDTPFVCRQPSWSLIHHILRKMTFAGDGAAAIQGQSDLNSAPVDAFVNQLIGQVRSEGYLQLAGLVGIGPFEQLQADISALASNLHSSNQLDIQALNDQLAADPAARPLDNPFYKFWRSTAAAPTADVDPGGRVDALVTRVDDLLHLLMQRYENRTAALGVEGAPSDTGGQKAAVTMEAATATEHLLLQKIIEPKQPAEIQAVMAGKDGQGPADAANNYSAEALLQTRIDKHGEDAPAARMQPGSKAAEAAANPNFAGQNLAARSAEEAINLKASALHNDMRSANPNFAGQNVTARSAEEAINLKASALLNDMRSADQTGNKVIQIDGESRDSGLMTSQENLPEHLSKLEGGNRPTEAAQRSLASQTLNQVVQKAVLLNNNGQNTVQIDLKPEFLGHIRMHIMTESQQVAVRIVVELPVVKDMLENNLNQLKSELQAQGLQVDELEVSVAHDSRGEDDRYQKAADMRRAQASRDHRISAEGESESQKTGPAVERDGLSHSVVDYFA